MIFAVSDTSPLTMCINYSFYPRGASDAGVLAIIMCLSVCVCLCVCVSHAGIVSKRLNVGSRKQRHVMTQGLKFSDAKSCGRPPSPEICTQCDPPPFQTPQFWPISAHSASTVRAGKNSSISANSKSTTRFPTSHRWTVYVTFNSYKGWHKTRFLLFFPVNFNVCRKTSATKFLYVKTSSGKVVATLFPYPMVHRSIAGDVPIYLKLAFKMMHPFRKTPISKAVV